jgi:hypothetical protein
VARDWGKIKRSENKVACAIRFPQETERALIGIIRVNPLETIRHGVAFVQRGFMSI